jgi:hypothetical protein
LEYIFIISKGSEFRNTCSTCGATRVNDDDIKAYAFRNEKEKNAAYHWAVGAHTQLNGGKPPCNDCGYQWRRVA